LGLGCFHCHYHNRKPCLWLSKRTSYLGSDMNDVPIFKTEALKRIANGKSEGDKIRHRNDYNNALNYMTTWHREDVISQYGSVDEFMRISQLD
jgi:hypothetical protein